MIAKEGIIFVVIGLVLTLVFVMSANRWNSPVLFGTCVLFGCLTLFTTFFFRDPERIVPQGKNMLVSPADGAVVVVKPIGVHPFIGGEAIQVSVFLSVFNVHINRVPASGTIDSVRYNPGKFHVAYADKASELNEQTTIMMTTTSGIKIIFKQIAGLIARRIVCKLETGQIVNRGDRFGLIRFGSRTDLILPADAELMVKEGDKVVGGESIIAKLKVPVESLSMESAQESDARL
ncbi:MAG: phosphatidylserine decarboxylase family protein [candidate division Zixibacteria bacterium]|nr:phosphatidylserine decarboxylase family protein [candidate division Zixibacteria bacterium]